MEEPRTDDKKFTVSVSSPAQCKRVLSIAIPEEELAGERERVAKELRRDLRVPGFRKGKVPAEFVRKNYGDVIRSEAVRNLLPRVYDEAVRDAELFPLGEPNFEKLAAEEGEGLTVEAHIEVRPEVKITGYDRVVVDVPAPTVTDADVESVIDRMRERLATMHPVERAATGTDFVIIDYAPYLESGTVDESARQSAYPVDLSGDGLLDGFRIGLVGTRAGDEKDIEVTYPEDFGEKDLAGQTKRFAVKVVEVKEKLLPEVDDAFAARLDDSFDSIDALRNQVREDLKKDTEKRYEHDVREKVVDRLIDMNSFDVPEVMVENYLHSIIEEDRKRRPQVDDEASRSGEIHDMFRDAAVRSIRKFFVLDAIKRQENMAVTDDDIRQKVEQLAQSTGRSVEEINDYLKNPEHRRTLENEMMDEKVLNYLREKAEVTGG